VVEVSLVNTPRSSWSADCFEEEVEYNSWGVGNVDARRWIMLIIGDNTMLLGFESIVIVSKYFISRSIECVFCYYWLPVFVNYYGNGAGGAGQGGRQAEGRRKAAK